MRRMRCKCGSEQFKIHPKDRMAQCCRCGQRYSWWEEPREWREFNMTPKDVIKEFCLNIPKHVLEDLSRAVAREWTEIKARHPKREKPPFIKEYITKRAKDMVEVRQDIQKRLDREESHLRKKWAQETVLLLNYGTVEFGKHEHKGKLRGKNIARAFHTDLKKIGYKTRLSFKGMTGIVKRL